MKKSILTVLCRTLSFLAYTAIFSAGIFVSTTASSQCLPEFDTQPADITVGCEDELPAFAPCPAATSSCCPGLVDVTSMVSETGNVNSSCTLASAYGP
ncbi:MAG: hypothetical protein ACKVOR_11995, partial [Flavobacteriales bacterium]